MVGEPLPWVVLAVFDAPQDDAQCPCVRWRAAGQQGFENRVAQFSEAHRRWCGCPHRGLLNILQLLI